MSSMVWGQKMLRNLDFTNVNVNTKSLYLRNHCFSEKTSTKTPILHSTLVFLCKCHACFIHKYMHWMYSIYESVGVRWSWHLVVINKWKALPCVSGGESQSPGSWLQVNSPENILQFIHNIYLHRHIKRLFLPDLLWFGSVWCCSSLTPDLRPVLHCAIRHPRCRTGSPPWNDNTEEYKIYQTTSAHAEGPYSVKLNNQLFWDESQPTKTCYT